MATTTLIALGGIIFYLGVDAIVKGVDGLIKQVFNPEDKKDNETADK